MGLERPSAELVARVADARIARLATVGREARPHVVPCCFMLEPGGVLYTAVDAKPKSTFELKRLDNIRANPAVSLLVDHYDEDWTQLWWVRVDGRARLLDAHATSIAVATEREAALDLLAEKYEQYRRDRPQGAVIAIDAQRWREWSP